MEHQNPSPSGGEICFTWQVPSPLGNGGETEWEFRHKHLLDWRNHFSWGRYLEVCTQSSVKSNSKDTDFNCLRRSCASLHPSFREWAYHYGDKSPQDGDWWLRTSLWGCPYPLETAFALFPSILSNISWHLKKWGKLIITRIHYPSQCSGTDPACVCRCKEAMKQSFEWKTEQLFRGEATHQALHIAYLLSSQCSESTQACLTCPGVPCLRDTHFFTDLLTIVVAQGVTHNDLPLAKMSLKLSLTLEYSV